MVNDIICLNNPKKPYKSVLFLGYDENQTNIIEELVHRNCYIDHTNKPIKCIKLYDLINRDRFTS